jgi:mannose-1-phosphate guanylyltransferase
MSRWIVVLAGGVGSRFWPLSTPQRPKQLLPLITNQPMLADTLDRLAPLADPAHILVLTNADLVDPIAALAPQLPRENLIAEPRPAGTAAALAWAAREIARRDGPTATMLCVHADWAIGDVARFRDTLVRAESVAVAHQALVTVGIVPTRPDPGFGYIARGEMIEGGVSRVARFLEKPDRVRAGQLVLEGALWNSGIFVWRVGDLLAEIAAHTPEVAPALAAVTDVASAEALTDFFASVTSVAIDIGVLERSSRVLVIPGDFGWDDVGTWSALQRVRVRDAQGNAAYGPAVLRNSSNSVVHSDGPRVVTFGVADLVVVAKDGLVLVTTIEQASDLKQLVESLPPEVRDA